MPKFLKTKFIDHTHHSQSTASNNAISSDGTLSDDSIAIIKTIEPLGIAVNKNEVNLSQSIFGLFDS